MGGVFGCVNGLLDLATSNFCGGAGRAEKGRLMVFLWCFVWRGCCVGAVAGLRDEACRRRLGAARVKGVDGVSAGRADGVSAPHRYMRRWRRVDAIDAQFEGLHQGQTKGRRTTNRAMPPGHSRALNAGFDSSYSSRDIAIGFARVACSLGGAGAVQGLEATTGTPTQPPASPKIR